MGMSGSGVRIAAAAAAAAVAAACLVLSLAGCGDPAPAGPAGSPAAVGPTADSPPPAGQSAAGDFEGVTRPRFDRTFKCDLVERLPQPPELVIFGGSRAQRFEPSVVERFTGLSAFNFAVQNSRPEDAYAMASWLFSREPEVQLRCFWALQATTLSDSPLHPGLLAEPRLNQFLPGDLLAEQREAGVSTKGREMPDDVEYTARGLLLHNSYDARLERGRTLETTLKGYLARMVPQAGTPSPYSQTRARTYFERALELFNRHGVEPVLVIMPYHPEVLAAFRAVGWGAKEDALSAYLESLREAYRFHVLDYTDIASFGGDPDAFYDGAHVKASNARRILARAVKDAPEGFR